VLGNWRKLESGGGSTKKIPGLLDFRDCLEETKAYNIPIVITSFPWSRASASFILAFAVSFLHLPGLRCPCFCSHLAAILRSHSESSGGARVAGGRKWRSGFALPRDRSSEKLSPTRICFNLCWPYRRATHQAKAKILRRLATPPAKLKVARRIKLDLDLPVASTLTFLSSYQILQAP
jgi:hypothetical protein